MPRVAHYGFRLHVNYQMAYSGAIRGLKIIIHYVTFYPIYRALELIEEYLEKHQ